jgi:phosphatidylethanolamine-binding protein (PEBP) family uncharacterized protein
MPARYTADGEGLSPPLEWSGIPNDAAATAILIEDPDAPSPRPLVHGIVAGLSAAHQGGVGEGGLNYPAGAAEGAILGKNPFLKVACLPPDPPPGHGTHLKLFYAAFDCVPTESAVVAKVLLPNSSAPFRKA